MARGTSSTRRTSWTTRLWTSRGDGRNDLACAGDGVIMMEAAAANAVTPAVRAIFLKVFRSKPYARMCHLLGDAEPRCENRARAPSAAGGPGKKREMTTDSGRQAPGKAS